MSNGIVIRTTDQLAFLGRYLTLKDWSYKLTDTTMVGSWSCRYIFQVEVGYHHPSVLIKIDGMHLFRMAADLLTNHSFGASKQQQLLASMLLELCYLQLNVLVNEHFPIPDFSSVPF